MFGDEFMGDVNTNYTDFGLLLGYATPTTNNTVMRMRKCTIIQLSGYSGELA